MTLLKKRILPIILSFAVVLSFMPLTMTHASAQEAYPITVSESECGVVVASFNGTIAQEALEDAYVNVIASPLPGYKVKSISVVETESGNSIEVDEKAGFTVPAAGVTVSAEFEKNDAQECVLAPKYKKMLEKYLATYSKKEKEAIYESIGSILAMTGDDMSIASSVAAAMIKDIEANKTVLSVMQIPCDNIITNVKAGMAKNNPLNILGSLASYIGVVSELGSGNIENVKQYIPNLYKLLGLGYFLTLYFEYVSDIDSALGLLSGIKTESSAIDIYKCYLNSDAFWKSKSRIIEAYEAKKITVLMATISIEGGLLIDEFQKCFGLDGFSKMVVLGPGEEEFVLAMKTASAKYQKTVAKIKGDEMTVKAVAYDEYVKLSWTNKYNDMLSYKVYEQNSEGKYEYVKTVKKNCAKVDGIAAKYKVVGVYKYDGEEICTKAFYAKPVLKKVVITCLKKGANKGDGTLTVKWNKVPKAHSYVISYRVKGGKAKCKIVSGNKTSYVLKKLTSNKKYYVKVRAEYAAGSVDIAGSWSKLRTRIVK